MHDPFASVQMAKEAHSPISLSLGDAQTWFCVIKEEALNKVIALKETEVQCLEKLYSPPNIWGHCSNALDSDWVALKKALGKFMEHDGSGHGKAISRFFNTEFNSAKELIPS